MTKQNQIQEITRPRTHHCGEMRGSHIGSEVASAAKLAGDATENRIRNKVGIAPRREICIMFRISFSSLVICKSSRED